MHIEEPYELFGELFLGEFHFEPGTPQIGRRLYRGSEYLGTYLSYHECICDIAFHWGSTDTDLMIKFFGRYEIRRPYKYRGLCSDMFWGTDEINRYIHYSDSIQEMFSLFDKHALREIKCPDLFTFGIQGSAIHLFYEDTNRYDFWLEVGEGKNVADIIAKAHKEKKFLPSELIDELASLEGIDVFISHKSSDFLKAKKVYDYLMQRGIKTFLSEMSLPNIADSDYSFEIDKALENAKHIVIIATGIDVVMSGWVRYEWQAFANEKRSGRKQGNMITLFDDNMKILDLPLLLRQYEVIPMNDLDSLKSFLV